MAALTSARRAVTLWQHVEFYLGTDQGERRWNEFWSEVRTGRRRYAWRCAGLGVVAGVAVGDFATVATDPARHPITVIYGYVATVLLAWVWGRVLTDTIAPLLLRNGQRTARVAYVVLQTAVFAVSPLLPDRSIAWGVTAGVLVALPFWISAALEMRRPVPDYPRQWRDFDTG